jgi:predicted transcriptional regulator
LEDLSTATQKNPRAKITQKKYQKQMDWHRNKVRELLIRGYSQYEISNILHISQPTISRDIDFIRNRSSSTAAKTKYLGHIYYYELQNGLDGIQELMKNLWLIIDNPNIGVKEKMKAIKLVLYCYNMRFSLIDCEPLVNDFFNREKKVKSDTEANKLREEEITRQEKALERALEDHLKNEKLTRSEISQIRDPDAVF